MVCHYFKGDCFLTLVYGKEKSLWGHMSDFFQYCEWLLFLPSLSSFSSSSSCDDECGPNAEALIHYFHGVIKANSLMVSSSHVSMIQGFLSTERAVCKTAGIKKPNWFSAKMGRSASSAIGDGEEGSRGLSGMQGYKCKRLIYLPFSSPNSRHSHLIKKKKKKTFSFL